MNGRDLRDEGMEHASRGQDAWKALAMLELQRQARTGNRITADSVTDVVGLPGRRNVIGALFSSAKRAGLIVEVGYEQATRKSRHASRQLVWRGVPEGAGEGAISGRLASSVSTAGDLSQSERQVSVRQLPDSPAPSRAPQFGDVNLIRAMRR